MLPTNTWRQRLDEMEVDFLRRCAGLWQRIWPQDDGAAEVERRLRALLGDPRYRDVVLHGVELSGTLVALARSFVRTVGTADGERDVLALAGVCTLPDCRGGGFGRQVVEDVYQRLGPAVPVCLFQTQVPGFYRKLGGREIDNPIVNASGEGRGFWDPHAMIHPGDADWPEGEIDIRGPGW